MRQEAKKYQMKDKAVGQEKMLRHFFREAVGKSYDGILGDEKFIAKAEKLNLSLDPFALKKSLGHLIQFDQKQIADARKRKGAAAQQKPWPQFLYLDEYGILRKTAHLDQNYQAPLTPSLNPDIIPLEPYKGWIPVRWIKSPADEPFHALHKINGIWFKINYHRIVDKFVHKHERYFSIWDRTLDHQGTEYLVGKKKQLNARGLSAYGLQNDIMD